MNKSKRKLPIGWRRLTPNEKITEECKMCAKDNAKQYPQDSPNINDVMWAEPIGIGDRASTIKNFIIIKPVTHKQTSNENK